MHQEIEKKIRFLFPKYKPASYSRFSKFFKEIANIDKSFSEIINDKIYNINISEIKNGNEKRRSIFIRHIPSLLGPENFYDLLRSFTQKINFFFIPGYISSQKKYMYAFVNVSNSKEIINIVTNLTKIKNNYEFYHGFDFRYIEIYFSKTQGYRALQRKYKNEYPNDFLFHKF